MNPFHLWLGLPEKATNPNHYQLLGIKPAVRDNKVIELAARTQLAKLKALEVKPNHVDVQKKIKQRIVKAHAVLSNEEKRAEYDEKLKALLAKAKQAKQKNSSVSTPPTPESTAPADSASSTEPATSPVPASDPSPSALDSTTAPETITASGKLSNVPMAVPIQPTVETTANVAEPGESFTLTNAPRNQEGLEIKRGKLKRKRKSWLVPILGLLICIGGIAGLAYVVTNLEKFSSLTGNTSTPAASTESISATTPAAESDPGERAPAPDTPKVEAANMDLDTIPTELGSSTKTNAGDKPDSAKVMKLEFPQLVQFRRHMENARNAMYRRDSQTANNEIQNAKALFRKFDGEKIQLAAAQIPMRLMAEGASDVSKHLEGFWQHVAESAKAIPGGQPIEANDRTLGFVEGTDEFVILRIEGSNMTFDYRSLPPGIALAIAEQGAKPDIPTYRMQKAAFYASHTRLDPLYRDRATEFAKQAAKDGHNVEGIIDFVSFDAASVGVPEEQAPQPPTPTMKKQIPELIVRLGVSDIGKMRPDQAAKSMASVLETAVEDKDDTRRAMIFEIAYMLAIKSGDVRLVEDVLTEYGLWIDYNRNDRIKQSLIELAKTDLDEFHSKLLLRKMINAAQKSNKTRYKKKLLNSGKKVAEKHGLESYLERLKNATK